MLRHLTLPPSGQQAQLHPPKTADAQLPVSDLIHLNSFISSALFKLQMKVVVFVAGAAVGVQGRKERVGEQRRMKVEGRREREMENESVGQHWRCKHR